MIRVFYCITFTLHFKLLNQARPYFMREMVCYRLVVYPKRLSIRYLRHEQMLQKYIFFMKWVKYYCYCYHHRLYYWLTSLPWLIAAIQWIIVGMKSLLVAISSACASNIGRSSRNCGPATKPFLGIDASCSSPNLFKVKATTTWFWQSASLGTKIYRLICQ